MSGTGKAGRPTAEASREIHRANRYLDSPCVQILCARPAGNPYSSKPMPSMVSHGQPLGRKRGSQQLRSSQLHEKASPIRKSCMLVAFSRQRASDLVALSARGLFPASPRT